MANKNALVQSMAATAASSLIESTRMLMDVCEQVQETEDRGAKIPSLLKEHFDFSSLKHRDGVERAVDFYESSKGFIARCDLLIANIGREKGIAEDVLKAFKEIVREQLELSKSDSGEMIPFKGIRGGITLQKNGGLKPLYFAFGVDKELTPALIDHFGIKEKYIKRSIDTERLRADLEAGEEIPWAALADRGEHVRFRK